jgi:hypothetical protein
MTAPLATSVLLVAMRSLERTPSGFYIEGTGFAVGAGSTTVAIFISPRGYDSSHSAFLLACAMRRHPRLASTPLIRVGMEVD